MAVRRKERRRKSAWNDGHVQQLKNGWDFLHIAWGDNVKSDLALGTWEATLADMRKAYAVHRDLVMEGFSQMHPGERPWAWWEFEAEQPRDKSLCEHEQLERMGLLTTVELEQLRSAAHGIRNEYHEPPFRRMWSWWRFMSPQPRHWSLSETEQLSSMWSQLTKRERTLIEENRDIAAFNGREWGPGLLNLSFDEVKFLGLELVLEDLR